VSPSWRDRITIVLHPERLAVARVAKGWRLRLIEKQVVPVPLAEEAGAPAWQPALEALQGLVDATTFKGADVAIILSSHFVRYVLVPWSEVLNTEGEQLTFARHCFTRAFGTIADRWSVRVTAEKVGAPRLACAIDLGLLHGVDGVMAPLGQRFRSLQPHLMPSFNACRASVRNRSAWFVVAERGILCLSLLQNGQWYAISTAKVGRAWSSELTAVLDRESSLCGPAEECSDVFVFCIDDPDPALPASPRWRFENLRPWRVSGFVRNANAHGFAAVSG
jgi:hypothetical protein